MAVKPQVVGQKSARSVVGTMADSNPVVIQENWETYSYNSEGVPFFVSFYAGAHEIARGDFPFCARVIMPVRAPNTNGGPTGEEAETLWRLEDDLTDALAQSGAKCILLARLTHAGNRELVFQVAELGNFRLPVSRWMKQSPDYKIDVSEHDGWGFFDDCVWPSNEDWLFISDRRVVDGLIQSGSDPKREHSLEFVFLGTEPQIQALRNKLGLRDYVDIASPTPSGQLVMAKMLPLDLDRIFSESLENQRLCNELGAQFDGWGAAVVN
jgi:hypothetical protein